MLQAYLYLNAALYVLFAGWCSIMPITTAGALGLEFKSGSGKSEYITVYGGMEFAIAVFFLIAAIKPELRSAGLLFALLFYAGLVMWRIPTLILISGVQPTTYFFAASEFVLGMLALLLWRTEPTPL